MLRTYSQGSNNRSMIIIYLKNCGTAQKEVSPAAARATLPIVATKLESAAQCGTIPIPPITSPPEMS